MNIEISNALQNDNQLVEELLWEVLWKPLSFKKEIRQKFKLDSEEIVLVAKIDSITIGVIVAYKINKSEYELRHLAVREKHQRIGIGKALYSKLEKDISKEKIEKVRTIARNTSQIFFQRLGFKIIQNYPDHPDFAKHGISFFLMEKDINTEQIAPTEPLTF